MNCMPSISSAALCSSSSYVLMRNSLYGFSRVIWRRGTWNVGIKVNSLDLPLNRFQVRCFSSRQTRASSVPRVHSGKSIKEEADAFFVVRKGDILAIYQSFSDCQAQVSSSVFDPSVSVYKGYSLQKETEKYLAARGLKDALYSINVSDVKEDLFGTLIPCPFQQPGGHAALVDEASTKVASHGETVEVMDGSKPGEPAFLVDEASTKVSSQEKTIEVVDSSDSCIIEFDGASKGNPGKSGAGAVIRNEDGSVIFRVREGLGVATNNVAEYRAMILGLKHALKKGFKRIKVKGDSRLVCMQVQDLWRARNPTIAELCKEAKELKDMFLSCQISLVKRAFNSDADAEANLAVNLSHGEVYEDSGKVP